MRVTDIVDALNAAGAEIRAVCGRMDRSEAKRVAGFEFEGATLAGTEQHDAYRAKLADIHALALQIRKGR